MRAKVVIDKSYLQGAPKARVGEIASAHGLLMSEALLYELVKAESGDRAKWFSKFPECARPFDLIPNPGTLFRSEISTNRSAGLPSSHVRLIDHRDTARYRDPGYVITGDKANALSEKRDQVQTDVEMLFDMVDDIPRMFPAFATAQPREYEGTHEDAESKICNDVDFIRDISTKLVAGSPFFSGNSASAIDHTWITFRWLQVNLLFALELWVKYPQGVRMQTGEKFKERLRHDVLDAQYLMLGLLEGAFATKEKKLCVWWKKLSPEGYLYSE